MIVFIDAKSAFDSVEWRRLREKMIKANYPSSIINTIEQLYNKAHTSPLNMKYAAKIKKGVL